jgi:hypothetical protein
MVGGGMDSRVGATTSGGYYLMYQYPALTVAVSHPKGWDSDREADP